MVGFDRVLGFKLILGQFILESRRVKKLTDFSLIFHLISFHNLINHWQKLTVTEQKLNLRSAQDAPKIRQSDPQRVLFGPFLKLSLGSLLNSLLTPLKSVF